MHKAVISKVIMECAKQEQVHVEISFGEVVALWSAKLSYKSELVGSIPAS